MNFSYWQLLLSILPVFAMLGVGIGLRRARWLTEEADASLLKMVVNFLYPCLIFENVLNNESLREPSNLVLAPLTGFVLMSACIYLGLFGAKLLGLKKGTGLRTFAFAVGINNYGYIPIPLMESLFGKDSIGLLLVHNVGCEAAIWTVGIFVLSGLSFREGWRKLINPPVLSLIVAVTGNLLHVGPHIPQVFLTVIHQCAVCAIPLGLILIGGALEKYVNTPRELFEPRISFGACLLRLGLFPPVYLLVAKFLPCTYELKRILVVEGAMPTGILLIVIAQHYGGHTLTAVRVVIGTTVLGILTIPLWLRLGLAWIE
ncbi:transporter [Nibricoccus aquaticus]|uniref:Transporter n=1 Tax=Nibricoccus aquaticus TaxID=2576891 RepID=A0A290Q8T1_9BACT|nr:AEC family transporter [Nibricoccus aquaticus]ATC63590.1 transporter [Nibricoccus aquaticus]